MKRLKKVFAILLAVLIFMPIGEACAPTAMVNASKTYEYSKQKNTSIKKTIESMTTRQKIEQMIMPAFRKYDGNNVTELNDDLTNFISTHAFAGIALFGENIKGTEQTVRLTDAIQRANQSVDSTRPQLILSADQEGGSITRLATGTQMVGNMALAASGDTTFAKDTGSIIGSELAALGINMDFAPVMDVNDNPSNPIIGLRSFSDDPDTVASFGKAYLEGLSSNGTISSLKHFPGHGNASSDSHTGLPLVDKSYKELEKTELVPYMSGVLDDAGMVMTAHIQFPQIETNTYTSSTDGSQIYLPATLSKKVITDILRGDLGFGGVVITDAMDMDAIAKFFDRYDAAKLAIEAGVDILLMPVTVVNSEGFVDFDNYIDKLVGMVDSGEIDKTKVDQAVNRILGLKESKNLLGSYAPGTVDNLVAAAEKTVGSKSHHDTEWSIAKSCITLIKNDGGTLPIDMSQGDNKTLILNHDSDYTLSAKYAIEKLKSESKIPDDATIDENTFSDKEIGDLASLISGYKNIIITAGLGSLSGMKGTDADKVDTIIGAAHSQGSKVIYISYRLPYDAARFPEADAIMAAYSPKGMSSIPDFTQDENSQYGANIPAAIFLAFDTDKSGGPVATLPVNIPGITSDKTFSDKILYSRGYGLTYQTRDNKAITADNFCGTYYMKGGYKEVTSENGGYFLHVNKIKKSKAVIDVVYLGMNYSPIYDTGEIKAKIKGRKATFKWSDSWENSGKGKIVFVKRHVVKLKMVQTKEGPANRATLKTKLKKFLWLHS